MTRSFRGLGLSAVSNIIHTVIHIDGTFHKYANQLNEFE